MFFFILLPGHRDICRFFCILDNPLRYLFYPTIQCIYPKKSLIYTVNILLRNKGNMCYWYIFSTAWWNQGYTNFINILILKMKKKVHTLLFGCIHQNQIVFVKQCCH